MGSKNLDEKRSLGSCQVKSRQDLRKEVVDTKSNEEQLPT
jgi:hypothetical protein